MKLGFRSRGLRWLLGISGLLIIVIGAGCGYALWLGSEIPRGTRVEGIDLGGLTPSAATQALNAGLREQMGPISVTGQGKSIDIKPLESGVRVDVAKTVAALSKRQFNPVWLVRHLVSGRSQHVLITVDEQVLSHALEPLARQVTTPAVDGGIEFSGVTPRVISPKSGTAIDVAVLGAQIQQFWIGGQRTFSAEVVPAQSRVSEAEVQRALRDFARPAVSDPLTVYVDGNPVVASKEVIAGALEFVATAAGKLEPRLLATRFTEALGSEWARWVVPPQSATLKTVNGVVSVVPSIKGRDVPAAALQAAVIPALIKSGPERVATVATSEVDPPLTTDAAVSLDLRERIGYFQTVFPWTSYRAHNIHRAADILNGTIVEPGKVFSLNQTLGERTEANGFVEGVVISGGRLSKDFGGGVSQVATTTWNAAWFAGLELLQHKPHSFYISRYPVGRESTVSWPDVDVKFRNNTGKPILITTSYYSNRISISIYGTRKYEVETITGPRLNPTTFSSYDDDSTTCINQGGISGFTIEVTRVLKEGGVEVSRKVYRTRYLPEDRVRCTNPKATFGNSPIPTKKPRPKPTATPTPTPSETTTPIPTSAP